MMRAPNQSSCKIYRIRISKTVRPSSIIDIPPGICCHFCCNSCMPGKSRAIRISEMGRSHLLFMWQRLWLTITINLQYVPVPKRELSNGKPTRVQSLCALCWEVGRLVTWIFAYEMIDSAYVSEKATSVLNASRTRPWPNHIPSIGNWKIVVCFKFNYFLAILYKC